MSALWTAGAVAAATGGSCADRALEIGGISIDSRTVQPGDLFVALVGENGDGHRFAQAALDKGAAAVLAHDPALLPGDARLVRVADTLDGLTALGAAGRARFTGRVAAVTGSVGKTTTKEMLRAILSAAGETHAAVASYNNHWGVPLTLARLPEHAAFCVAEIGMNHPGEIAPLAALVRPHVAVVTTVAASHIGHMGSLEAIAREKGAIYGALGAQGVAVVPAAAPHADLLRAAAAGARIVTFGPGCDTHVLASSSDIGGSDVTARIGGQDIRFRLNAPGVHMVSNALAALSAAEALGVAPDTACRGLADFRAGAGRGALREIALGSGATITLLDESYNASGASMRAALGVLSLIPARRRVAALGDMRELGVFGGEEHANLASSVRESADLVFTCGELMNILFDTLPASIRGAHAPDAAALAPLLTQALRDGDAVLVKGSFGSRMRDVVAALDAGRGMAG